MKFWKKTFLYIVCTGFLEFVATKFNQNLRFTQLFIQFVLAKTKNLYSLHWFET